MAQPPSPAATGTRRAPARALVLAGLVLALVVAAGGATASGQEGEPPPADPAATTSTTLFPTPSTLLLPDGDFGIVPPGATPVPEAGPPPAEGEPVPPPGPAPELPPELAEVVLPDPTPGLNAALAAIDVSAAERSVAASALPVLAARERAGLARLALAQAVQARRAVEGRVAAARSLVEELAVNVLVYGDPAGLDPLSTPETLGELRDRALRDIAGDHVEELFDRAVADLPAALEAEAGAERAVVEAQRAEHDAVDAHLRARTELERAQRRAREARNQVGPAILGPSVLDAADLIAWYRTFYAADPPVAPIADIISTYLQVGAEEGVTGDIAFAQAILETGGFRSGHAQGFNFAGIGAYDHCAPACGFRFADLEDGVRAHVQLLRAYADPSLTSAKLAVAPNPRVAPERIGVRGCCQRWASLAGVWASDQQYDRKVLGIYRLMVETARALDRQQQ